MADRKGFRTIKILGVVILVFFIIIALLYIYVIPALMFSEEPEEYSCKQKLNDSTYVVVQGETNFGFLDVTHHRSIELIDKSTSITRRNVNLQWSEYKWFYALKLELLIENDSVEALIFYNHDNSDFDAFRTKDYTEIHDSIIRKEISNLHDMDSLATPYGDCEITTSKL